MKPIHQTSFFDAETGEGGNCFQAALASFFELPLEDVPTLIDDPEQFEELYIRFVGDRGYSIACVHSEVAADLDAYYLALGPSKRGCGHVVVYRKGVLAHDPHPSAEGLLTISFVHLFIPADVARLILVPNNLTRAVSPSQSWPTSVTSDAGVPPTGAVYPPVGTALS